MDVPITFGMLILLTRHDHGTQSGFRVAPIASNRGHPNGILKLFTNSKKMKAMRIKDVYSQGFGLSFEIFPPKSEQGDASLIEHLDKLMVRSPAFVSCTYGAGGTTQSRTLELCQRIQERWQKPATAHFTCVGASQAELLDWLQNAERAGIRNIMALRGDPPAGQTEFKSVEGGLRYANELVRFIRDRFPDFGIGVAGYPEKHPEATTHQHDLENLKRKVDAGADAIFTQLFYENDHFLRFRDQANAAGIHVPIIPGIMPITEFARVKRIVELSGTAVPVELLASLEQVQEDRPAQFEIGVDYTIRQCRQLLEAGVPGIHFYVMNRSEATLQVLDQIGKT
ncbi:MAG TPA: methylenetetrahydrofolate reductase [NAD(P)H] [Planctomicrobium sp.]|nr:methylenetetrahydrofolate reductase [NAD(P)H] [Planctomicrobium sp.]